MIKTPCLISFFLFSIPVSAQTALSQFADPTGKYSTTSSGSCACSITNTSQVADNDLSNNATIVMAASVFGANRGIRAKLNSLVPGNTKAGFFVRIGSILGLLPTVTLTTYKSGSVRETLITNGNIVSVLGGSLGYICATTGSSSDYDEVGISLNSGVATLGLTADIFYAYGGYSSCPIISLPVKLIHIAVSRKDKKPMLTWEAEDNGNTTYEIQRSNDGETFTAIGIAISDNTNSTKTFYFTDTYITTKNTYYRIRATDNNLTGSLFSKTVSLPGLPDHANNFITVFPNPVTGKEFMISIPGIQTNQYDLHLIDKTGKIVYTNVITAVNTDQSIKIILNRELSPGVYIVSVKGMNHPAQPMYSKLIILQ